VPVILTTWEAEIGRIVVQGQPGQIVHKTTISKITTAKWTGGVAQVVEHLLCKCEDLSSNPLQKVGGGVAGEREKERRGERKKNNFILVYC
jgi:hypothetical protein